MNSSHSKSLIDQLVRRLTYIFRDILCLRLPLSLLRSIDLVSWQTPGKLRINAFQTKKAICHGNLPFCLTICINLLHNPISLYHIFIHQILKFLSRCHLLNFLTAQIAASLSYRRGCLNLVNFALSSFKVIHLQFSSYNWLVSLIHSHILDRFMPLASWSSTTSVRTVLQLQLKFNSFSITI